MSKVKTRICEECRRPFETKALYLSTCEFCVTDQIVARESKNPNSIYSILKMIWENLKNEWKKKEGLERQIMMKEYWLNQIRMTNAFKWKDYVMFNYYMEVPLSYQIPKKEFDLIRKELQLQD